MANTLSTQHLTQLLAHLPLPNESFKLVIRKAPFLPKEQDDMFSIFSKNMRTFYQSSAFGWNPSAKKKELFHKRSRFLIVREASSNAIAGYLMWRFEEEDTVEGDSDPVVYVYELSIHPDFHKRGLGRYLVRAAEDIGRQTSMRKMVLTLLKVNKDAAQFYEKVGFTIDPISPSQFPDGDEVDYEIMSKPI